MNKLLPLVIVLSILVVLESGVIVADYPRAGNSANQAATRYSRVAGETVTVPYDEFNVPLANYTDYKLKNSYDGSWVVDIYSLLVFSSSNHLQTEAQIVLSPEAPSERAITPTIIVQERADGLLRVEYFAQNWPNSFGLLLYNSSSPGWLDSRNVTLKFVSFGPAAPVDPQLAPRPNGNLTVIAGNDVYVDNYPIAWANLSSLYAYGLQGSTFQSGSVQVTFYHMKPKG